MAPLRLLRVQVVCGNGEKFQIMWSRHDSVYFLKSKLAQKTSIPQRLQELTWQGTDSPLCDDRLLSSYNLRDDAILMLTVGEMMDPTFQAFAKLPGGRTLTMLLASSDSIEHVKEMIHVESGKGKHAPHLRALPSQRPEMPQ